MTRLFNQNESRKFFDPSCNSLRGSVSAKELRLAAVFTNIAFANALAAIVSSLFGDFLVTAAGDLIAPFNFVPLVLGAKKHVCAGRARSINRGKPLGRGRAPGSNERMSATTCYVCRPGQCIRRLPLRTS